jgi:hypothetical protein
VGWGYDTAAADVLGNERVDLSFASLQERNEGLFPLFQRRFAQQQQQQQQQRLVGALHSLPRISRFPFLLVSGYAIPILRPSIVFGILGPGLRWDGLGWVVQQVVSCY